MNENSGLFRGFGSAEKLFESFRQSQQEIDKKITENARAIAERALEIKAIKLNFDNPFTWASGYRMPIYNDNRMFLWNYDDRILIAHSFLDIMNKENIRWSVVAGTSTAGISPATTLGDYVKCPIIYVRGNPKDHGLKNQIEGIDSESNLGGKKVVLIEDLISTGGSSIKAVEAIRNANGKCDWCLSIFDYGFKEARDAFANLEPPCNVRSALTYGALIDVARDKNYINCGQAKMLEDWREDPLGWGEKRGFPRVEKNS